ncbi:NH(3)-dependent NAD(+) synthetase [Clostridia bacterium]|nr:NH(3)-dependent NAD(+) synthetase [Clostridia bacterium]
MKDFQSEVAGRVAFLQKALESAGASGFVYGNSGGKDSALVGILCKQACENTVGVTLPCQTRRNFEEDTRDALEVAAQYHIQTRTVDLSAVREALIAAVGGATRPSPVALANIAPRLRMAALYAIAASENRLVVGTGNRSEAYMGYFTKWGDGAHDINPIADLTVTDIYALLRYLDAPRAILEKAPSAALFEGQTDEGEMGVTYSAIDHFLGTGEASAHDRAIIDSLHARSEHKRQPPIAYAGDA